MNTNLIPLSGGLWSISILNVGGTSHEPPLPNEYHYNSFFLYNWFFGVNILIASFFKPYHCVSYIESVKNSEYFPFHMNHSYYSYLIWLYFYSTSSITWYIENPSVSEDFVLQLLIHTNWFICIYTFRLIGVYYYHHLLHWIQTPFSLLIWSAGSSLFICEDKLPCVSLVRCRTKSSLRSDFLDWSFEEAED